MDNQALEMGIEIENKTSERITERMTAYKEAALDMFTNVESAVVRKKEEGGKEVIVEILLIVVGIVIALVFRESIGKVVTNLVTALSTKISGIMS